MDHPLQDPPDEAPLVIRADATLGELAEALVRYDVTEVHATLIGGGRWRVEVSTRHVNGECIDRDLADALAHALSECVASSRVGDE